MWTNQSSFLPFSFFYLPMSVSLRLHTVVNLHAIIYYLIAIVIISPNSEHLRPQANTFAEANHVRRYIVDSIAWADSV